MRRREEHNGARQETFAYHMVKATAKARNTQRLFAARLMQTPYTLRIRQKLRAWSGSDWAIPEGSDQACGLLDWLLNSRASPALSTP